MRTTFILDAHGLLYQLFHALPPMSSPNGEPVGAVFGFTKDLFSLIEKYKPDTLFCAFDLPGETFRHELYSEYKANRSAMPDDLRPQIQFAREILEAFRITPLSHPGFEADDILATVARLTAERNENCVIVSSDKDCRQLINDHVSLLNIRKQSFYRAEELFADWGIRPEQVVDFQSFVGDPTDNVPGVPLIGPKIASELLQKYETLEGVFENVKNIAGKKRQENIQNGKETALLSRQLVRLNNAVPIEIEWKAYRGFDAERLRELFKRFGFRSLLDKLLETKFLNNVPSPPGGRGFLLPLRRRGIVRNLTIAALQRTALSTRSKNSNPFSPNSNRSRFFHSTPKQRRWIRISMPSRRGTPPSSECPLLGTIAKRTICRFVLRSVRKFCIYNKR